MLILLKDPMWSWLMPCTVSLEYHDKINFGHSTVFNWIDFFRESNIGELVIFHHDPNADDEAVTALFESAGL